MKHLPKHYQAASDALKGRIIIVTGAGDGIGRCAAREYAAKGATVILMGRTIAKLEQVYDEILDAGHPEAAIYPIDFEGATENDYDMMRDTLDREFGRIDGLLVNASLLGQRTPISGYRVDVWQKVFQVNVTSPFMMIKALTPLLNAAPEASVILTSSSVGRKGRGYWGAYSASKAAIENLCDILADEWEGTTNIRINSLNPGATRTNMRAAAYPAENPQKVPPPEHHMPLYVYLMGSDSRNISGEKFSTLR